MTAGSAHKRSTTVDLSRARVAALGRKHWMLIAAVVAALLARVLFWVVANRTWEDALITLAHVRNATEGLGLTHHAGERPIHGFTSALSVLLPLGSEFIVSGSGLTAMRIASLVAAVVAVCYAYAIAGRLHLSRWPTAFVLTYVALNELQIFYGMSGMETQLAVAILLAGAYHAMRRHDLTVGILAGLAALARPDLILWVLPVLAWSAMRGFRSFIRVAVPAGVIVAPWLLFTTTYYGSPVPNTVLAKAAAYSSMPSIGAAWNQWVAWAGHQIGTAILALLRAFMPFYEDGAVVAAPIPAGPLSLIGIGMIGLALIGAWRLRRMPDWWPVGAYLTFFLAYWCLLLPPVGYFNWYLPPFTALIALLIGAGLEAMRRRSATLSAGAVLMLAAGVAIHLPFAIPLERIVQMQIDDGIRREVGLYLAAVVPPGDAVTTEPAGYIGYYSRVTLWDHPGLTSPTARAAVATLPPGHRDIAGLAAVLHPPWLVLRPPEWEALEHEHPDTASCYAPVKTFGQFRAPAIGLNGLVKWNQDWVFTVYRRSLCAGPG